MRISYDTSIRLLHTLVQLAEKEGNIGKLSMQVTGSVLNGEPLDKAACSCKIDIKNYNRDAEISDDKVIFRTADNGKKYAINVETGETSGLGPKIDKETATWSATPKKWSSMSDSERLAAKHPKNTTRAGHKNRSDSIRMNSMDEMVSMVQKDTGTSSEEARKMVEGCRHYAGATYTYHDVRVASRVSSEEEYKNSKGKRRTDYAKAKEWADGVEAYIDSAPVYDGGPLTRGVSDKHNPLYAEELYNKAQDAMKNGKTIDMNGFSSWSTDEYHAGEFGEDCSGLDLDDGIIPSLMYVLPRTYQGVSVDHFNEDIVESEVLISKKARFRPTKCYVNKNLGTYGSYIVELEEE